MTCNNCSATANEPCEKHAPLPLYRDGTTSNRIGMFGKRLSTTRLTMICSLLAVTALLYTARGAYKARLPEMVGRDKPGTCLTPACIHASSEYLYNLSPQYKQLDPCSNFEELVCGGWKQRNDLRPDQGDAFTGTIMSENSQSLLRHVLEEPYPEHSEHSHFSPRHLGTSKKSVDEQNFDKMKSAYDACLDEDVIKKAGVWPLMDILHQVQAMFPAEGLSTLDQTALSRTVGYLAELGISALIAAGTGADDTDPDTVVVQVSPPYRIGLPAKEWYGDEKVVNRYKTVVGEVFAALFPQTSSNTTSEAVVEFEKSLAAASPEGEDWGNVTKYYNPMTLEEADALTPQLDLAGILTGLAPNGVTLSRLIVTFPNYMTELSKTLASTPIKTVQSYFIWKAIQSLAGFVEVDALLPYRRFSNELQGKDPDSQPERWRTCVRHVDDGLGWILSRFFVEKAFSADAKAFGDRIVTDIKTEFSNKLKATEWMEPSVIQLALSKVQNIVQKIGYPTESPDIMNPTSLQQYYAEVPISSGKFFDNGLAIRRFDVKRQWSALGKPVDRNEWGMTVPTVNAYYNPPGNEIVFPAGIMQFPVFSVDLPQYVSYGAFASVAGHELSHAFDSTGRHYDQNGNYTDWWTPDTVKQFESRAECFVKQYSEFSIPGPDDKPLHVNGHLTLGENIADAGGVSAGFNAWKRRSSERPDQDLPGLDFFTQDQLFFVSYANWWCGKSRKETAINRIYTDPHAPKWARIIGTMANSREFREAFSCPAREPTCELW